MNMPEGNVQLAVLQPREIIRQRENSARQRIENP